MADGDLRVQTDVDPSEEWVPISALVPLLGGVLTSHGAVRYHVANRQWNGLEACDAVRSTPLGLRANPQRFRAWALGRRTSEARDMRPEA